MRTVLRPGLRQCFELNVGWLATLLSIVMLDSSHLVQVQGQQPFLARSKQFLVGHTCYRDLKSTTRRFVYASLVASERRNGQCRGPAHGGLIVANIVPCFFRHGFRCTALGTG